jgi:hypothetical protein
MSTDQPLTTDKPPVDVRAGFWRRLFSILIDLVVVVVPFQIVVAVLFAATSGHVQMTSGIAFQTCSKPTGQYGTLVPPPPPGSNFAQDCSVYFFGAQTARVLVVGRVTQDGATRNVVSRGYSLDRDGHPVDAVSVDWIAMLTLLVYWLLMETGTGATLGQRVTRSRVIDVLAPHARGVSLRKIFVRYLMMGAAATPMLAVLIVYAVRFGPDIVAMAQGDFFTWFLVAGMLTLVWVCYVFVQVGRRRDPIYDRVAGTAVVRGTPGRDAKTIASTFD